MAHLLIVEDEPSLRALYQRLLVHEGYSVRTATTLSQAEEQLRSGTFDLILSDVRLPDGRSLDKIADWHRRFPQTPIILLTAFGQVPDSVKALKAGAYDYLLKGDEDGRIIPTIAAALANRNSEQSPTSSHQSWPTSLNVLWQQRLTDLRRVAASPLNILLLGESGVGKEVLARAIHQESGQKGTWVAINCAALPAETLESELFGHSKGAFTGAVSDKKGLVEEAENGTLFLDEIGEMPLALQAKLLRLLENQEFYRLGETKVRKANFRLIAATNQNLKQAISERRFREDLYYRLADMECEIPPLRQRKEDIETLVNEAIASGCARLQIEPKKVSPTLWQGLKNYGWPGNIRQLKKVIERALVLTPGPELGLEIMPSESAQDLPDFPWNLQELEDLQIRRALEVTAGNREKAAQLLGIGVATLYRKLKP